MPQPSFIGSGTAPMRTDTRWTRWEKILGYYQNLPGALAHNNPARTDTLRLILFKLLRALNGV